MSVRIRGGEGLGAQLGCFGRVGMTLFFLVFLGFGLVFSYFIGRGVLASIAMRGWARVPCEILESVAEHGSDAGSHRFVVRYRYDWQGRALEGDRYRPNYTGGDDAGEAERLAARHPAGSVAECLVDPAQPESSALEPTPLVEGLFLLLPLAFVAVGAGGIVFVWRFGQGSTREAVRRSISQAATRQASTRGWLIPFFSLFVLIGLALGYFLLWRPLARVAAARSWTPLPCAVESSAVRSHAGDDSTTYSVDIVYRYELDGRTYRGNRYDFLGGSSSGYDAKQRVVDAHPPGSTVTCYADPADPTSSVLRRDWSPKYLLGLFSLAFLGGGVFGLWWTFSSNRRAPSTAALGAGARRPEAPTGPSGPVTLKPTSGPLARTLGTIFVALFWNGITGLFLAQVVEGWRSGNGDVFLTLFLTPFVLIGLALLAAVPHQLLASTNPRPRLELASGRPRLGEIDRLDWSFRGSVTRLTSFRIRLEGREEATYRRGTTTSTDRHVFHSEVLFEARHAMAIERGSLAFQIPAGTMHSFAAPNNRVVWAIKLEGEIPRWPDLGEEYALEVLPQEEIA